MCPGCAVGLFRAGCAGNRLNWQLNEGVEFVERRQVLKRLGAVAGGAFYSSKAWPQGPTDNATTEAKLAVPLRVLVRRNGTLKQPLSITVPSNAKGEVVTSIDGVVADHRSLTGAGASFDVYLETSQEVRSLLISVDVGKTRLTEKVTVKQVRKVLVYVLPHSHHDLGYTDLQAAVEEKQMQNISQGIEP